MTSYLQIEDLTKSYGDRMLFDSITFGVNQGDKIGIIAKNGTGKSTLLRIIAGNESPDSGKITFRNDLRVAFLEQKPQFPANATPLQVCSGLARQHDDAYWTDIDRVKQTLSQLSINDFDQPLGQMSGGQQKRVAIAQIILQDPDLVILDEPTNHLDIRVIEWLENWLKRSRVTLMMVTHDRYFLDRVCNRIIEMDMRRIFIYDDNYDTYLRRRAERIEALSAEQDKIRNTLRREQQWMSRQPQARGGKAKFRIDAFHELKSRSGVSFAEKQVNLNIKSSYIGSKIFEAVALNKSFGDKRILREFTYDFARYEKVGIVGANGVGKSTFIKILQGLIPPDSGTLEIGETVRFGYYSQEGIDFNPGKRVIDAITEIAEDVVVNGGTHYSPMQFLQHFLFSPADQQKYISTLSGGERCRLHLAAVLMRSPNFLILDEPTNDLDIITLGILEEYLADFKGCVIVVSHDRFFLDSICDHLFVMEGDGEIKDFPGTYAEYREWANARAADSVAQSQATSTVTSRPRTERPPKLSFKEKREMQQLEAEIEQLGNERAELEALFASGSQIDDYATKATRYAELKDLIDEKEMRWLELSEKETR